MSICVNIDPDIDSRLLAKAWDLVIDRYPILKTRIIEKEGEPFHSLDDNFRSKVNQVVLPYQSSKQVVSYFQDKVLEPFDFHSEPLSRVTLFRWNEKKLGLFMLVHHIVFDGYSTGILLRSLFDFYKSLSADAMIHAPNKRCVFADFVEWEQRMLESDDGHRHSDYWKSQLSDDLSGFRLLPDAPHPMPVDYKPEVLVDTLPAEVCNSVRDFAKKNSLQHSSFFLAVIQILLHKYTNQKSVSVVMPVIVRPDMKFADEIGFFFNIVPIRANFETPVTLEDFMRTTQITMLDAVFHSAYPFPLMMSGQKTDGNQGFNIFYAYQEFTNLKDDDFQSVCKEFGLSSFEGFRQRAEGDYDLAFEVFKEEDVFRIQLQSNPKLYSNETIRALLDHFHVLLLEILEDPARIAQQYPIATSGDKKRVLIEWNDTAADYPRDRCIHDFFLDQVLADASRSAVIFGNRALSYGELDSATHSMALYLQSIGIEPDMVVAICVERSIEMMIGLMGAVRSGGAYMPIDPDYPDDRIGYMLQDSAARIVLTQGKFKDRMASLVGDDVTVVSLDEDWIDVLDSARAVADSGVDLVRDVKSHNVAYVIYTSGSTGKPKGVLVEHMALVNRIHWMQKLYALDSTDVVMQKTPYCFDVSVWEFFWTPMTGASLVFAVPNGHSDVQYLERLINATGVTTLHYVPSMLHTFLDNAIGQCNSVRQIFCSGEALDRRSVDRYRNVFPNAVLHNLYGPTEAAIDVTYFDCSQLDYPFVPIGSPIDNTQIYIVDAYNNPQPVGVPGELHIAGDNLARGYLNRLELTNERFISNPFTPGTRMYKTGDLARWLDDGNIQYLGRIDDQVKIGGVRIETGEIESHLNRYPAISESVVIARGQDGYKQLIAFYRIEDSIAGNIAKPVHKDLRAHLLETLPEYMIPAAFVQLPAIPVTSNGKADRGALARIDVGLESSQEYVAPRNEIELKLAEIWASVFKEKGFVVEQAMIGVNDNFFELGGNSLLATQLLYRIRSRLGVDLPVRALFEQVTIGRLADLIATIEVDHASDTASSIKPSSVVSDVVVSIQSNGDFPAVFALPGIGGNVLTFRGLSKAMGDSQPFYALQAFGLDGAAPPFESVEDTAHANNMAIRMIQPHGPYRIVGHSYGGVVAYEMTRQLLDQGEDVEYLALIDSMTPAVVYQNSLSDEFEDLRQLFADLAEKCGQLFELSSFELRGMPTEELLKLLHKLGIALKREEYDRIYDVFKANRRCYELYRPGALPRSTKVLLFRATQSLPDVEKRPEDYGWKAVMKQELHRYDVQADHYSILSGDALLALSQVLISTGSTVLESHWS